MSDSQIGFLFYKVSELKTEIGELRTELREHRYEDINEQVTKQIEDMSCRMGEASAELENMADTMFEDPKRWPTKEYASAIRTIAKRLLI